MALPLFYFQQFSGEKELILDEDNSKHLVQVLRKKVGDSLRLSDGKGNLITAEILDDHKRHTLVRVAEVNEISAIAPNITIAISLVKNTSRFEWFLEKATEIGVNKIIPLICQRTEKERFRADRLQQILISAMLQSQQAWLPELTEPIEFEKVIQESTAINQKFIAHCEESAKQELLAVKRKTLDSIIMIGPEGDFTNEEIAMAVQETYEPVTLGDTRLRTETAGMVAATLLRLV